MWLNESKDIVNDILQLNLLENEIDKIEDQILQEVGTSTVRINKTKKRKALAGGNAMHLCKRQNPGLYKRYKKLKDATKKMKEQIMKKYKNKGMAMARKEMR